MHFHAIEFMSLLICVVWQLRPCLLFPWCRLLGLLCCLSYLLGICMLGLHLWWFHWVLGSFFVALRILNTLHLAASNSVKYFFGYMVCYVQHLLEFVFVFSCPVSFDTCEHIALGGPVSFDTDELLTLGSPASFDTAELLILVSPVSFDTDELLNLGSPVSFDSWAPYPGQSSFIWCVSSP